MCVTTIQGYLGYIFSDSGLLELALTHRSYGVSHNERLEFLGDAILDFLVAEMIYQAYPAATEGELSSMRAQLVCGDRLAEVGRSLQLGDMLFLGAGEARAGGRQRPSIIADAVEALIAAVYLDGGMENCRHVVHRIFLPMIETLAPDEGKDAKTTLQEYLQSRHLSLPVYEMVARGGSDHDAVFVMACSVSALRLREEAEAPSRKRAEQRAARKILDKLGL